MNSRLKQAAPSLPGESVSRGFADRGALEGYPSHYTSLTICRWNNEWFYICKHIWTITGLWLKKNVLSSTADWRRHERDGRLARYVNLRVRMRRGYRGCFVRRRNGGRQRNQPTAGKRSRHQFLPQDVAFSIQPVLPGAALRRNWSRHASQHVRHARAVMNAGIAN